MPTKINALEASEEYAKKLYSIFDTFHENLVTTRNFVGTFGSICIDKIAEYQPNAELQKELSDYLASYIKEKVQGDYTISEEELKADVTRTFNTLLKKYNLTLKEFDKKTKEKIANGTKLGIELNTLSDKLSFYRKSQKQIYKNALENMITYFKEFLSSVLKEHFLKNISSLNSKTIKFELVNNASSIEDIKEMFVLNELEELFHKNISEIFIFIEKELKIELPFLRKHKTTILELFYRRNICVHNNCKINKTYLESSRNPYKLKLGIEIQNTEDYLYNASSMLLLFGAEFVTNIINKVKFKKDNYDEEVNGMSKIAFECYLKREDWDFSQEFYEILSENKHLTSLSRDVYKLNIMLCKKNTKQISIEQIKKKKMESKREFVQLGVLALCEEYDSLSEMLIKNYGTEDGIDIDALKTWPIFKKFRKTHFFTPTVEALNKKTI